MRRLALVSVGLLSLSACNFLNPSGGAAARWAAIESARLAAANPSPGEDKICKSIVPTGSIMPRRVCSTATEWAAFEAETAKTADAFNDLRRSGSLEPATEGSQFQAERP